MKRNTRGSKAAIAVLVAGGLLVAACGGDDDASPAATNDEPAAEPSDEPAAEPSGDEPAAEPSGDEPAAEPSDDEPAAEPSDEPADGVNADTSRRLRLIGTNGVQQVDPVTSVTPCEAEMLRWVYDSLIYALPDGTFGPGLAESWDSPDPLTFVLNLREGVVFQDGTPFNAEAVKSHLERGQNDPLSVLSSDLASIDSIDTPDDVTVVLNLSEPRAGILPAVFADRAGMVPSPTAVAADGDTYGANGGIGAGPYAYDSHTPVEDFHVSAWDGYWNQANRYLAGIDMLGAASEFQIDRIESGEVDYAALKDTDLGQTLAGAERGVVEYNLTPTAQYAEIYINWEIAPFDDVRVRQALNYAIDRELLAQALTEGSGVATYSPISPGSWAHNSAVDDLYPYDPEKARELLAEAGYPDGVDLTVGQIENPYYTRLAAAVQDMVAESGFNFELESVTGAEINNRLYQLKDLPIAVTAFRGTADPGPMLEGKFGSGAPSNPAGTTVDGVDELLAQGAASVDQAVRAEAYMAAELLIMENALSVPLFHNGGLVAYIPDFEGVQRGYTTCEFGDFVTVPVYFEAEG